MALTTLICAFSMYSSGFMSFQQTHPGILIAVFVCSICTMLYILCAKDAARQVPTNYYLLFLFTFCEAYIVGFICGQYDPRIVFMAAASTLAMTLSLTLYAFTTKRDITMMGGTIFIMACGLMMFGLFAMFTNNKMVHCIYNALGIIIYGFYLIYDT